MDEGALAIYQMVQPLVDSGGILDDHQILAGEGVVVVHQQLENMDCQGKIIALWCEGRIGGAEIPALKLRGQIIPGTGAAAVVRTGGGVTHIEAVVIQQGDAPIQGDHDILAVQIANDAGVGMEIVHRFGQIDGYLKTKKPVVIREHGLGFGYIAAPGYGADFHAVLDEGHGVADEMPLIVAQNILRPGQSQNSFASGIEVRNGVTHQKADFLLHLWLYFFVDFGHQVFPGNPVNPALATGTDFLIQPVAVAVSAAGPGCFPESP